MEDASCVAASGSHILTTTLLLLALLPTAAPAAAAATSASSSLTIHLYVLFRRRPLLCRSVPCDLSTRTWLWRDRNPLTERPTFPRCLYVCECVSVCVCVSVVRYQSPLQRDAGGPRLCTDLGVAVISRPSCFCFGVRQPACCSEINLIQCLPTAIKQHAPGVHSSPRPGRPSIHHLGRLAGWRAPSWMQDWGSVSRAGSLIRTPIQPDRGCLIVTPSPGGCWGWAGGGGRMKRETPEQVVPGRHHPLTAPTSPTLPLRPSRHLICLGSHRDRHGPMIGADKPRDRC